MAFYLPELSQYLRYRFYSVDLQLNACDCPRFHESAMHVLHERPQRWSKGRCCGRILAEAAALVMTSYGRTMNKPFSNIENRAMDIR